MKTNNVMKKIIDQDFDETENYLQILSKRHALKKSNKYKIIIGSLILVLGLVTFQYLPMDTTKKGDDYFLTTIYAENEEYNIEESFTFSKTVDLTDLASLRSNSEVYWENNQWTGGYRINLEIAGDNIEKVIYRVENSTNSINIYRGISGELQFCEPAMESRLGHDDYEYVEKTGQDLTKDELMLLLQLSGYPQYKPEELNEQQLYNLVVHNEIDFDFKTYEAALKEGVEKNLYFGGENTFWEKYYELQEADLKDADKILGKFEWDFIEKGKEIILTKDKASTPYVLYFMGTYDSYPEEYLKRSTTLKYEYNPMVDDSFLYWLPSLAKETVIKIDIVYKNGSVKTKTLTYRFKNLGKGEYGYPMYSLEGTMQ